MYSTAVHQEHAACTVPLSTRSMQHVQYCFPPGACSIAAVYSMVQVQVHCSKLQLCVCCHKFVHFYCLVGFTGCTHATDMANYIILHTII